MSGVFGSFRVEEAYTWRGDIMNITRQIVHEADEARLSNIADHFEADLSEIREFLEMKRRQQKKPRTNYDQLVSKTPEELARWLSDNDCNFPVGDSTQHWLDWLKSPADKEDEDAT